MGVVDNIFTRPNTEFSDPNDVVRVFIIEAALWHQYKPSQADAQQDLLDAIILDSIMEESNTDDM